MGSGNAAGQVCVCVWGGGGEGCGGVEAPAPTKPLALSDPANLNPRLRITVVAAPRRQRGKNLGGGQGDEAPCHVFCAVAVGVGWRHCSADYQVDMTSVAAALWLMMLLLVIEFFQAVCDFLHLFF